MPIEIGLNPIVTSEGTFVLASIIDITERKRAEEALRLATEQAQAAANTRSCAISSYRSRILENMGMKNNAELTTYAIRNHLVD